MACASEKEKERETEKAAPSSRPLHNFALPSRLKWGHQKHLRCVKVPHPHRSPTNSSSVLNSTAPPADHCREQSNSPISVHWGSPITAAHKNVKAKSPISTNTTATSAAAVSAGDTTGIEAVREQLMNDLKVAADQLKLPIVGDKGKDINNNDNNNEKKPSEEELPWNLRARRPAGKASNEGGNVGSSPLLRQERGPRTLLASDKGEGSGNVYQRRPGFSLALSKEEIETDFLLMTGAKPPRRPKKRPKSVQKQIDGLFPGSWLTAVTPENYKVPDVPEPKVVKVRSEGTIERL